jgi:shikimate kinase
LGGALKDARASFPYTRILLIGFMGSGKSTVGRLLASELEWVHIDLDAEIERREGRTVGRIFDEDGEEGFRAIEGRVAREALDRDRVVISAGGGWPCREGRMEALDAATLSIWLRVPPERAVERASREGTERPLLRGNDPVGVARELQSKRERYYQKARWQVDTEARSPEEVVRVVTERLGKDSGRPSQA